MNPTIPPSSNSHHDSSQTGVFKKRRVQRACDMCRKRKIKCSGGENPGESCVNCKVYNWACTFGDPAQNDKSSKSYVEDLESRLQRTERLLKHLCPDESLLSELDKRLGDADSVPLLDDNAPTSASQSTFTSGSTSSGPETVQTPLSTFTFAPTSSHHGAKIAINPLNDMSALLRSRASETGPESIMGAMARTVRQVGVRGGSGTPPYAHANRASRKHGDGAGAMEEDAVKQTGVGAEDEYDSEDDASHTLAGTLENLRLDPPEYRFFGKSSGAMLIRRAMEMKSEFIRNSSSAAVSSTASEEMAQVGSVSPSASAGRAQANGVDTSSGPAPPSITFASPALRRGSLPPMMKNLRPEFWLPVPWERGTTNKQSRPSSSATSSSAATPASASSPSIFTPSPSPPSSGSYASVPEQAPYGMNLNLDLDFDFPPPDLARELIELYFANVNLFMPLLHRPTFDKLVKRCGFLATPGDGAADGQWGGDAVPGGGEKQGAETGFRFAHVYLLVCAVGAYFSEDPRCLLDASEVAPYTEEWLGVGKDSAMGPGKGLPYSGGWKWFDQVQMSNRSLIAPPTLYDLQVFALSAQFLQASTAPQSAWTMCGIGIRLAQDVGAHRRGHNTDGLGPTKEGELWKKAFWVLVVMDRIFSCHLGRSCAIQDEDFDLEPPLDCDDDFWDVTNPDPQKRFKQPLRKPSNMTHFLLFIELTHILTFSLRTIYSINKSQVLSGMIGPEWEKTVVSELDSALNKWADAVPDHLKWDPHRENVAFFNQSASLWATYYHIQILVHRPFIQSPRPTSQPKEGSLSMIPSLAICTNAARACCHIVDVQQKRTGPIIAHVQMAVFQSGVILLLSIWSGKRSGLRIDPGVQMADVRKCMQIIKTSEKIWFALGRLCDLLFELASVSDIPHLDSQSQTPFSPSKRQREQDRHLPSDFSSGTSSAAPSLYGTGRHVPVQPNFIPTNAHIPPPSSGVPAAEEQVLSATSMSLAPQFEQLSDLPAIPQQASFDLTNSTPYAAILPAAVALPDIDFTRFATLFAGTSSTANAPAVYNFESYMAAAQGSPHTGPQPAIQGHEFAPSFDTHRLPLGPVPQNANDTLDFSAGYSGQTVPDNDSMDVWMSATSGINFEELGAYLANLDALTQNALGGSGTGWPGANTGYQRYSQ